MVDNIIRPLFIGGARACRRSCSCSRSSRVRVYGFPRIFLAPVILAALLSFVDMYRERYASPGGIVLIQPPAPTWDASRTDATPPGQDAAGRPAARIASA